MKPLAALLLALPLAANAEDWCPPPAKIAIVASDDFNAGLANWRLEAEDAAAQVTAKDGLLDIQTPAGLSLWWHQPLSGDYAIRFEAQALPAPASARAHAGRLSDLNMFWNAAEADGAQPRPRSGKFSAYDELRAYYVGFGANANTTTRLRVYEGQRRLLQGFADASSAEPGEQPMHPGTRLHPGQTLRIEIVSRRPTPTDPVHLRWSVNGQALFTRADAAPRLQGHFALRTTASRLQISKFQILQCRMP
ncbi:MAG TPA: DUF6250 domain-containing protein [Burkholderiaceae bacterium]